MQKSCFGYPVEFADDVFGDSAVLAQALKKVTGSETPRILIVADQNVVQRTEGLGSKIGRYVQAHGIVLAGSPVVISGGEKIKADNLQSALQVVSAILSAQLGRDDVVLAIGGGAVLDVAGYAAAQARGGVRIVRLPTTPASMMDAAFADYAAVDSSTVKDALRVPSGPAAVVIDVGFAASVLDGVWRGGLGEAVRLAVAADAPLLKKLVKWAPAYRERSLETLAEIVKAVSAVRAKKGAVDFALWAASRLESMSGYKLPHGYAIAIGIAIDLGYAVGRGVLKADVRDAAIGILRSCGAMDGMTHSGHLLGQADNLLLGLDAWAITSKVAGLPVPTAAGAIVREEKPDREVFRSIFKELLSSSAEA